MELEQPRKSIPNWARSARHESPGFNHSTQATSRERVQTWVRQLYSADGISPKGTQLWVVSSHHCLSTMAGLDSPQNHWRPLLVTQNHLFPSEYNCHEFFLVCVFSWGNYQEDSHWEHILEFQLLQLVTGTHLVLTVFLCYPFLDASYPLTSWWFTLIPKAPKPLVNMCFSGCSCSTYPFCIKIVQERTKKHLH